MDSLVVIANNVWKILIKNSLGLKKIFFHFQYGLWKQKFLEIDMEILTSVDNFFFP